MLFLCKYLIVILCYLIVNNIKLYKEIYALEPMIQQDNDAMEMIEVPTQDVIDHAKKRYLSGNKRGRWGAIIGMLIYLRESGMANIRIPQDWLEHRR